MRFFLDAAQRQTSGLTACADPFTQLCDAAEYRPAVAKTATSRGRPPQRRNDHDPRTPRKGRLRPGKLQLNPLQFPPAAHSGLPKGAPVRDPNAAEPQPEVAKYRDTARQAAAETERHDPRMPRKGPPQARALYFARGARCSAFAESSRSCGTT